DAVLLSASLSARPGDRLAEAGCGFGAALLCAGYRLPQASFTGFDRDNAMLDLAREGIAANGFDGRVEVFRHDVLERTAALENAFDQAFANPPFFEPAAVRAPAEGRR